MRLSVFIPSHNPQHLDRAIKSVLSQADGLDVEIVVLLNGDARSDSRGPKYQWINLQEKRVRIFEDDTGNKNIGYLKRRACELCTGDVFVELDHDDELLPGCLSAIWDALYEHRAGKAFFYSATDEINGHRMPILYGKDFGWEHGAVNGSAFNVPFPATARSICEIFYAPNHVRAWTRAAYEAAGGHDASLEVGDDHDLICRTYLTGAEFIMDERPLYCQHMHGANSQHGERNAKIQIQQALNRDKYLTPLVHEWCRRNNYAMLDLGGAHNCPVGYIPVDVVRSKGGIMWDVAILGIPSCEELNKMTHMNFSGIGCIRAKDFLEHIPQPRVVPVMNSIHKALVPGGWFLSLTPSTDGRGAFCDPTHVSFWNELSFRYYTQADFAKFVPEITAKFQQVQMGTMFLSEWEKQQNIPYVQFNGCALHGQRQPGATGFPR